MYLLWWVFTWPSCVSGSSSSLSTSWKWRWLHGYFLQLSTFSLCLEVPALCIFQSHHHHITFHKASIMYFFLISLAGWGRRHNSLGVLNIVSTQWTLVEMMSAEALKPMPPIFRAKKKKVCFINILLFHRHSTFLILIVSSNITRGHFIYLFIFTKRRSFLPISNSCSLVENNSIKYD